MKEVIKILLVLVALVIIIPLVWIVVKEIWYLIVPLFGGFAIGNAGWALLLILSLGVIVWALSN